MPPATLAAAPAAVPNAVATAPSSAKGATIASPVDPRTAVAEALKKVTTIATLPEVTAQIVSTVEDPRSTASQLHKIVAHDPALVTRILKVVNSALYGLPGQIGSVERAIVLLGLNAIKNIAVAASLGQLFRGVKLCEGFSAKDLWQHCIAVAVTARELARQMKLPIADEAFLAGLIHDVGILVALQVSPEKLRAVCELTKAGQANPARPGHPAHPDADFCAIERQIMGLDHQQLGMALAEQWKFTRPCQLVAGYHHQPKTLADNTRLLVTLVYVADTLCCQAHRGFDLTALSQKLEDGGIDDINLSPALIEKTRANLDTLIASAVSILG